MLDNFIEDLVAQIRDKPASSDAHTNVSILKELLELTQGDLETELKISSGMWNSIFMLKKAQNHVHLKLMLEQYVVVFLRTGILHQLNQRNRHNQAELSEGSQYFSKSISAGAFDFLLNHIFSSDSFDLRMLGVMAFKLSLKSIRYGDHMLEVSLVKEKVLQNIRTRESVESRCLVDFYFEFNSYIGTLAQALKDFPQIGTLVSQLEAGTDLDETKLDSVAYLFMSYLTAKSQSEQNLSDSEYRCIKNLLLASSRLLSNPSLDSKSLESITYFLKMLAKLDLSKLELHRDSH